MPTEKLPRGSLPAFITITASRQSAGEGRGSGSRGPSAAISMPPENKSRRPLMRGALSVCSRTLPRKPKNLAATSQPSTLAASPFFFFFFFEKMRENAVENGESASVQQTLL